MATAHWLSVPPSYTHGGGLRAAGRPTPNLSGVPRQSGGRTVCRGPWMGWRQALACPLPCLGAGTGRSTVAVIPTHTRVVAPARRPTSQHSAIRCAVTAASLRSPTVVLKPGGRDLPVTSQTRLRPARRHDRSARAGALAAAASLPALIRDHQGRGACDGGKEGTRVGPSLGGGAPDRRLLGH